MVQVCCVRNCRARAIKNSKLSFHPLPISDIRRKVWAQSLKIKVPPRKNNLRVCSRHFRESDYLFGSNIRRLSKCAIPRAIPHIVEEDVKPPLSIAFIKAEEAPLPKKRTLSSGQTFENQENCNFNSEMIPGKIIKTEPVDEIQALREQVAALQDEVQFLTLENQELRMKFAQNMRVSPIYVPVKRGNSLHNGVTLCALVPVKPNSGGVQVKKEFDD